MNPFTVKGDRMELFVPFEKYDEASGVVEGWATIDQLDAHKEICDVEKSWPAIVAWSESQADLSKGKSVGNIREQHRRNSSAGIVTKVELTEKDGVQAVYVASKAIDEGTKAKIAAGALTGFSFRGLAARWADEAVKGAKRIAFQLVEELSYVDRPAVPHALFEVVKSTGEVEMVNLTGRQVAQFWSCNIDGCTARHDKKEEAMKCEGTGGSAELPTVIEATSKSAVVPIETGVLIEKCLDCAASVAYLIQRVTTARPAKTCAHDVTAPCGHYCYNDPGHEEMEAGVKQLWDSLRAMVSDLRTKWMAEEGVTDETLDVVKMLEAITLQVRNTGETLKAILTPEVLKSLHVPSGNGSLSHIKTVKEDHMDITEVKKAADEQIRAVLAPIAKAMGGDEKAADIAAEVSKAYTASAEVTKALGTKLEEMEKSVDLIGTSVAKTLVLVTGVKVTNDGDLGEVLKAIQDAPAAPKAVQRTVPVSKADDTSGAAGEPKELSTLEKLSTANRQRIA